MFPPFPKQYGFWTVVALLAATLQFSCASEENRALRKSKAFLDNNQPVEARTLLEETVKKFPDHVEINYLYGWTLLLTGDQNGALFHFGKCLNIDPNFYGGHKGLGAILFLQNKLDKSEEYFQKALTLKPDSAETLSNLAKLKMAQQKPDEAEEILLKATAVEKRFGDFELLLAEFYARQKDPEKAKASLKKARSRKIKRKAIAIQTDCVEGSILTQEIETHMRQADPETNLTADQKQQLLAAKELLVRCEKADPPRFRYQAERAQIALLLVQRTGTF